MRRVGHVHHEIIAVRGEGQADITRTGVPLEIVQGWALDHLIATRLFRKLVKRFDLRSEKLDVLKVALELLHDEPLVSGPIGHFREARQILNRAHEEACEREGKSVGGTR